MESTDRNANAATPGALGAALGDMPGGASHTVVADAVARLGGAPSPSVEGAAGAGVTPTTPPAARARHIVGQLAALPRIARSVAPTRESAAERIARRRSAARATLDAEAAAADWGRVSVFGAGIAIGALIGVGAALLLAPAIGGATGVRPGRRARPNNGGGAGGWVADRWVAER